MSNDFSKIPDMERDTPLGEEEYTERQIRDDYYFNKGLNRGLAENMEVSYRDGRIEMKKEILKAFTDLWNKYEADKENIPKPDFMSAVALVELIEIETEIK